MSRLKVVLVSEVSDLLHGWDTPVFFGDDHLPQALDGIPDHLRYGFIASGALMAPHVFESSRLGHTNRVGGIYVIRHAPDDPKPFNRDDYALVPSPFGHLWLDGLYRHPSEHWADQDELDKLLQDIRIHFVSET